MLRGAGSGGLISERQRLGIPTIGLDFHVDLRSHPEFDLVAIFIAQSIGHSNFAIQVVRPFDSDLRFSGSPLSRMRGK